MINENKSNNIIGYAEVIDVIERVKFRNRKVGVLAPKQNRENLISLCGITNVIYMCNQLIVQGLLYGSESWAKKERRLILESPRKKAKRDTKNFKF